MSVISYAPNAVTCIVAGNILSGWADDSMVTIERNEDAWMLKVGVDGIGTRAKNNNRSGKITFKLMQTSPSNSTLSALTVADELSGKAAFTVLIRDANGSTLVSALTAWVAKFPSTEFGKEVLTREWSIETDNLIVFVGGQ